MVFDVPLSCAMFTLISATPLPAPTFNRKLRCIPSTSMQHAALSATPVCSMYSILVLPLLLQEDIIVLSSIGEGAFGEVSLAACTIFGRVAVKWLKVRLRQLHGGLTVPGTPHLLHLGCKQAPCCSPASHCMAYSCIRSRAIVLCSMSAVGARQFCFHNCRCVCRLAASILVLCMLHAAQRTSMTGDNPPAAGQGGAAQPELLARG